MCCNDTRKDLLAKQCAVNENKVLNTFFVEKIEGTQTDSCDYCAPCECCDEEDSDTIRRCLVEEVRSFSETEDGKTGESNRIIVTYRYDGNEFDTLDAPVQVAIQSEFHDRYGGEYTTYNRLQLEAHIKNLEAILEVLE